MIKHSQHQDIEHTVMHLKMYQNLRIKQDAPFIFPGLFRYVYIKSRTLKHPKGPAQQAPNPINIKP